MSATGIGTSSVRSYDHVVANGECSLCATKQASLYRFHRRMYGETYDSHKHGPLVVQSGRVGYNTITTSEEVIDDGQTKKTITIATTVFQQLGTDLLQSCINKQ